MNQGSVQMKHLFWIFWWADGRRCLYPGLHAYIFGRDCYIIPVAQR